MLNKKTLIIAVNMFVIGFIVSVVASEGNNPFSDNSIDSPSDRITAENLHVFADRVIIDQEDLIWAKIKDTHSMEPVLNAGSISLELPPVVPNDIKVGDIISFKQKDKMIVHRVVLIGEDKEGWFAATKGDNNKEPDAYKVRFSQVRGVLVGILY